MSSICHLLILYFIHAYLSLSCAVASTCQDCAQTLTNAELVKMKIEIEKARILKRLNLAEPPKLTRAEIKLPPQLQEQIDYEANTDPNFRGDQGREEVMQEGDADTRKLYIRGNFVERDSSGTDILFDYTRNEMDRVKAHKLLSTVAWIKLQQTHSLKSAKLAEVGGGSVTATVLPNVHVSDHWLQLDVSNLTTDWNKYLRLRKKFNVILPEGLSVDQSIHPQLILETGSKLHLVRSRRSLPDVTMECSPDVYSHCCMQKIYLNFSSPEVNWDWIIRPEGFITAYCTGNCLIPDNTFTHAMTTLSRAKNDTRLMPCCTQKLFTSLKLLYAVGPNDIQEVQLDNFVPLKCGC